MSERPTWEECLHRQAARTAPMMAYSVRYPSGRTFSLVGWLLTVEPPIANLITVAVELADGRIIVLDPRAEVTDQFGIAVFHGCTTEQLIADTPAVP